MQTFQRNLAKSSNFFFKNLYRFGATTNGLKTYHLTATGNSWNAQITDGQKYTLNTDPKLNQPLYIFISSLIACEQATSTYISKQMGITIQKIEYDIKADRDERGFGHTPITETPPVTSAFQRIYGTALVETNATQEQLEQLQKYLEIRCPVARLIRDSGCKLEVEWKKK